MEKRVVAVIVTYNRKEMLKECIDSLLAQHTPLASIMIVDNDSVDGTREHIQHYIERGEIQYFNTGANLGGAGGFSYGMKRAAMGEYEYAWVMDDDCIPEPDALEALLSADREVNGKYGFLSSKVLWKDNTLCRMNLQRRTLTRNLKSFDINIQPIVMASFVSLFVPIVIIKEMGLPIKEFFIWSDDWEYTRRLSRQYPCYAISGSTVIHKCKENVGADIANYSSERIDRFGYLYRNDVYLYRREGLKGFCYEVARIAMHIVRVLIKSKDSRLKRIHKIISGTWAGIHFHPEIEYIE